MSTAIALGGMVKAALRMGVSFPTEAHPLHENEGVELWTQSSAPHGFVLAVDSGQMKNRACTFNKALIYTVFLFLVFENILYQRRYMYLFVCINIIPTIIDTTSQPQLPNPDGPYGALSSAREMPKLTLRFDVQADDQGKAVAVAVKPILGRKLLGEKKGGWVQKISTWPKWIDTMLCLGLALWCPSCFATHFLRWGPTTFWGKDIEVMLGVSQNAWGPRHGKELLRWCKILVIFDCMGL